MKWIAVDDLITEPWTEQELELLKCLLALKLPVDIIANELKRSCTATILKAIESKLDLFSSVG